MPTLTDRLKPFVNQHCLLALSEKKRGLLKSLEIETRGDALPLYVFDWDDCDAELKGIICEEAGQDDFACFAVLNPDASESDLDEIVSADNSGYFLISDETIYIGSGELEPFTDNLDEFISGLRVRSEAELAEEEEEEGDEEESDDDEDDAEGDGESAEDEEPGESGGGEEPLWLRLTKETDWASISKEERWEKLKQMAQTMNWHAYDWKSSPAADLSFPDFSEEELGKKAPWLPKHYNDVREMNVCHVPDLNGIADGDERKMLATYGVPVAWPTKAKDPAALNDLLDLLDAARAAGGEKWKEAMESHGLLNDEHYLWLRHDKLGYSKQLSGNSDAVDAILKEIDAAIAQGDPAAAFQKYELRDRAHYDSFVAKVAKLKTKAWAKQNQKLDETYARLDAQAAKDKEAVKDVLGPVAGISLEDWARSNAKILQGTPVDSLLPGLKVDKAAWDTANKEWNARMVSDKTFTVMNIYSAAFMGDAAFAAAVAKARGK